MLGRVALGYGIAVPLPGFVGGGLWFDVECGSSASGLWICLRFEIFVHE